VPVAVIGFLPASVLVGKPAGGVVTASFVSVMFFIASLTFWRMMLKNYSSAGG
jgi:ABC-2 type transport system permease protein